MKQKISIIGNQGTDDGMNYSELVIGIEARIERRSQLLE